GFVFGYIPMVAFIAVFKKRADTSVKRIIVLTLATLLLYFFGVFWFILAYTHTNNITNFIFILNFIPGDIIKIIVSVLIFPKIKSVVNK
ncbi:MAG: biotin transporter BioY, partial [Clostridia bacterium]|nr:biotin transporter BioY [Clostridia bacterium]